MVHQPHDNTTPPPVLKIAWIIKGLGLGGAERIVADLVPILSDESIEIEVLSTNCTDALAEELRRAGIEVSFPPSQRLWAWWLATRLLRGDFEIVHTHSPLPAAYVSMLHPVLRRFGGWPTYNVDTAHTDVRSYNPLTRVATKLTSRFRDRVLATSEISMLGVPNETVVHHGVPAREESHEHQRTRSPGEGVRILSVAGLRPQKDHETLLRSCAVLRERGLHFSVDLVGDGPLRHELEGLTSTLGLEHVVSFLGWRHDVREILPDYDVFVLATHFEGFPIALVEATAAGVPSVASDVPGNREALTLADGRLCGRLAAAGSVPALAAEMEAQILAGEDAVLADLIALRSEELSIEHTAEQYRAMYRSLFPADGR